MLQKDKILHKISLFLGLDNQESFLILALRIILLILCIAVDHLFLSLFIPGIILPKITLNKYYWMVITILFSTYYVVFNLQNVIANHVHVYAFLLILGTLTVILYKANQDWKSFFGTSAKWLIGLIFLLATIGKFLAPEFLDGSFFEYTAYNDFRFNGFTTLILGENISVLEENKKAIDFVLSHKDSDSASYILKSDALIEKLSVFMVYWTIFIEGLIAILFLFPDKFKISRYRDLVLILFILTTYPIATVNGFAMCLFFLAFTQSYIRFESKSFYPVMYLLLFLFISVFSFPFARVIKLFL